MGATPHGMRGLYERSNRVRLGVTRTLRLKVRAESYRWLDAAAIEVSQVWNWCNQISAKAARPYVGKGKWLSGFDLCKLSAGATRSFEHIGAVI